MAKEPVGLGFAYALLGQKAWMRDARCSEYREYSQAE
jgi:hypothetical protein